MVIIPFSTIDSVFTAHVTVVLAFERVALLVRWYFNDEFECNGSEYARMPVWDMFDASVLL